MLSVLENLGHSELGENDGWNDFRFKPHRRAILELNSPSRGVTRKSFAFCKFMASDLQEMERRVKAMRGKYI